MEILHHREIDIPHLRTFQSIVAGVPEASHIGRICTDRSARRAPGDRERRQIDPMHDVLAVRRNHADAGNHIRPAADGLLVFEGSKPAKLGVKNWPDCSVTIVESRQPPIIASAETRQMAQHDCPLPNGSDITPPQESLIRHIIVVAVFRTRSYAF